MHHFEARLGLGILVRYVVETYGFYESHFMNESRVEDITETIAEVSYNLKCQYGFWQSGKQTLLGFSNK